MLVSVRESIHVFSHKPAMALVNMVSRRPCTTKKGKEVLFFWQKLNEEKSNLVTERNRHISDALSEMPDIRSDWLIMFYFQYDRLGIILQNVIIQSLHTFSTFLKKSFCYWKINMTFVNYYCTGKSALLSHNVQINFNRWYRPNLLSTVTHTNLLIYAITSKPPRRFLLDLLLFLIL